MKIFSKSFLVMFMLIFFSIINFAQTAVSDSGTAYSNGPYLYEVTYAGTLSGTDTVITKSFDRGNFDSLYTLWYDFNSTTDSVKCKVLLQGSGITDSWATIATLNDSIEVETPGYINDNFAENANKYRFQFIGLAGPGGGNGYTTTFAFKAVLRKE